MSRLFPTEEESREYNALARIFYEEMGCISLEKFDFGKSNHPQEQLCYALAVLSREFWEDLEDDR